MSPDVPLEVEWQFDAPDLGVVERWLREQPAYAALRITPSGDVTQSDTYSDSADWRIYLAGYSFRIRERGVGAQATLKALGGTSGAGPISRAEINEPTSSATPPTGDGPVASRLRLLLGAAELVPMFTVRTHRKTWDISADGRVLVEIALDDTEVEGGSTTAQLRRVEVEESSAGALVEVEALVEAMRVATGLVAVPGAKFAAGLAAAGLHPAPPDLGPHEPSRQDTIVERALVVLRRNFSALFAHESGAALGEDPEQLHAMRVAARRLRAAFRVFGEVLPSTLTRRGEFLSEVGDALGAVRDLDVQIERFDGMRANASWDDANAFAPLLAVLREQRNEAHTKLVDLFSSDRYQRFAVDIRTMLMADAASDGEPVGEFARPLIRSQVRRFNREAQALRADMPHDQFHEVRKRGKRLRYILEFFADLYGAPLSQALRLMRQSQDRLGELQDLAVTDERLRGVVQTHGGSLPPQTLIMIGRLLEQHRQRGDEITAANARQIRPVLKALDRLRSDVRERQKPGDDADADLELLEEEAAGSPDEQEIRALVVAAERMQPAVRSRTFRAVLARLLRGARADD